MPFTPLQSEAPALRTAIASYLAAQSDNMDWAYTSSEPTQVDDPKGLVWLPRSTLELKGEDGVLELPIIVRVVLSGIDPMVCADSIHDWGCWLTWVMSALPARYTEATYRGVVVKQEWIRNIRPVRSIEYEIPREGLQRQDSGDRFAIASLQAQYTTEITLAGVNFC